MQIHSNYTAQYVSLTLHRKVDEMDSSKLIQNIYCLNVLEYEQQFNNYIHFNTDKFYYFLYLFCFKIIGIILRFQVSKNNNAVITCISVIIFISCIYPEKGLLYWFTSKYCSQCVMSRMNVLSVDYLG